MQKRQKTLSPENQIPAINNLDELHRRKVRDLISPHNSNSRKQMQAVLKKILYDPPKLRIRDAELETINRDVESIKELLISQFNSSVTIFNETYERAELIGRGRWRILLPMMSAQTLKDELSMMVGEGGADELVADLASFFARRLVSRFRKFRIFSLDIKDPEEIVCGAEESFPQEYRDTVFFWRTSEMNDHIRADMLKHPFKRNSLAFISSVEGYPFYFNGLVLYEHKEFADRVAASLKPGGRAVFFPWIIDSANPEDKRSLKVIEKLWKELGLIVSKKKYSINELTEQMGDREITLTMHSPVFQSRRSYLEALRLEKPLF